MLAVPFLTQECLLNLSWLPPWRVWEYRDVKLIFRDDEENKKLWRIINGYHTSSWMRLSITFFLFTKIRLDIADIIEILYWSSRALNGKVMLQPGMQRVLHTSGRPSAPWLYWLSDIGWPANSWVVVDLGMVCISKICLKGWSSLNQGANSSFWSCSREDYPRYHKDSF